MRTLQVKDLRNIREACLALGPGVNVLVGRNAQGKTSLLEAIALLARGRSFRTDETRSLIRHGSEALNASGTAAGDRREWQLSVEVGRAHRRLSVDGRETSPGAYVGRLEAVVYSTERLRIVRGPMKERRTFLDRAAGALSPAYRQLARDYERVLRQRNAALEAGGRGLEPWTERLVALGASLRERRAAYVERLRVHLQGGGGLERYDVRLSAPWFGDLQAATVQMEKDLAKSASLERRLQRTLAGPHRDLVALLVDEEEATATASSGQVRSLLLALCLAMLEVHRAEHGEPAVALLDDLDSELDDERAHALVSALAARGQVVVTTAHPGWTRPLADARVFQVEDGRVAAA